MRSILCAAMAALFFVQFTLAQQPSEISVSLKAPDGKYVGQVAGGGLDASSAAVTAKQTFGLIDLNGGKIADGDKVKLRMDASQWHEDKEKSVIHRVPIKGAKEEECQFKLHIKDKLIYFETPSGKFVKVDNNAIVTAADAKSATLFDVQTVAPAVEATGYPVALAFAGGNHIGMVPNGGMDAVAKEITANQIFQLVDINGGNLASGDMVKLVFGQSQVREDKEASKIHRVPIKGAKEDECVFKLILVGNKIRLQAPSGKFVVVAADGKSLATTDKKDDTSLLTAIPNPTPVVK